MACRMEEDLPGPGSGMCVPGVSDAAVPIGGWAQSSLYSNTG